MTTAKDTVSLYLLKRERLSWAAGDRALRSICDSAHSIMVQGLDGNGE